MVFTIVFLILYGLGLGACRLAAMLFSGIDAAFVKNIAFIPILNVIATFIIIFFLLYLVKDYRANKKKIEDKSAKPL